MKESEKLREVNGAMKKLKEEEKKGRNNKVKMIKKLK